MFVLVMSTPFCMIEPPQCYGEVQHTTAVTRTSCVGQLFCKHQPGMNAITPVAEVKVFYSLPLPLPPLMYVLVYYNMYVYCTVYVCVFIYTSIQLCILTSQCLFNNAFSSTHFFSIIYTHILSSSSFKVKVFICTRTLKPIILNHSDHFNCILNSLMYSIYIIYIILYAFSALLYLPPLYICVLSNTYSVTL